VRAHEPERYVPVSRSVAGQRCASKVNEPQSGSADEQHSCWYVCVTAPCAPPYAASARDLCSVRSHYDARCYALLNSSAAHCWGVWCELILPVRCSQHDDLFPGLAPSDQRVSQLPDCAALRTWSLQTCASPQFCSLQTTCELPPIGLPLPACLTPIYGLPKLSFLWHGSDFR